MGKRIFIADNRKHVIDMMEERLSKSGYDVISTCEGSAIIKTLNINNVPNLIVLEAGIDGVDPLKVCRSIKSERRLRDVPFLLLKEANVDEQPFRELGIKEFITRPCDMTDVLERIRLLATYGTSKARPQGKGTGWKIIGILLLLACFVILLLFVFLPGFTNPG